MKVIIMPRDRAESGIFSLSAGKCLMYGFVLFVATLYAGSRLPRALEAGLVERSGGSGRLQASPASIATSADKRALDALFTQVGVLQANHQRLEVLSRRVAALAGLSGTDLKIVADRGVGLAHRGGSDPQKLIRAGQHIRALQEALAQKAEQFMLLDFVFTKQMAAVARQPTALPIAPHAQLSSTYGWRRHPFHTEPSVHEGLDFAAPTGTPILASAGGVVRTAAYQGGFGNLIEIDHGDGLLTRYAHAKILLVKKGALVTQGQMIARVGSTGLSTGPHLHFEVRKYDQPLDPRTYLTGSPLVPASVRLGADR